MVKWKKKKEKKMKEVFCVDHKEACLQCSRAAYWGNSKISMLML